ncbi:MAG: hypothetical protein V3T23_06975 [Nitrososphaerales archaeon]
MKIREKCPGCGATHDLDSQSIKRVSIYCGCEQYALSFDVRGRAKVNWRKVLPPSGRRRPMSSGGPIVKGHSSGNVVPADIAKKLKEAFGGGTVTGRTPSGKVQIKDSADGELRFIESQPIKWGDMRWGGDMPGITGDDLRRVDILGGPSEEKKNKRFEGHGCPDIRSKLVRQFQDEFGRD